MFAKIFLVTAVFMTFGNPSETKSTYHKEYYQTGTTKAEGWLHQGAKTGYWKFYHKNGKVSGQGHYKNGQRIKYWYFYNQHRVRIKEGHYQNGKKTNWWLFYDNYGRIHHKCQLNAGIKNGYCLQYMNDELTSAIKYQNGKKVKEWFNFSSFRRDNNLSDLR